MNKVTAYLTRKFSFRSDRNGTFVKVLGLWLAYNPFGNCFSPALILSTYTLRGHRAFKFTLRTRSHMETTVYFSRGSQRGSWFWWNSAHLARRFGTASEQDFGTVYFWRGHCDL